MTSATVADGIARASDQAATRGRLAFADGLRGIAALWVVLFHLSEGHHVDALKLHLAPLLVTIVFDLGHLGVGIFFVLSGFVMALTVDRAVVDARYAGRFLLRRLLRLTPPYWFAVAFCVLVLVMKSRALGQPLPDIGAATLLAHAFYAQDMVGIANINIVFWTLCIEVQFYFAFALLLWLSDAMTGARPAHREVRLAVLGVVGLAALAWPLGILGGNPWRGGFLPFWYAYLAGVFTFWGWEHQGRRLVLAAAYAAAIGAAAVWRHDSFAAMVALTCAAILLSAWRGGMGRWLSSRPFQFVGLVSYSLYLLHNPLTGMSFRVLNRLLPAGGVGPELVGVAVTLVVCLGAAWACFLAIERPAIRMAHAIKLKKSAPR
ncbi:MAG: acyltransferase [Ramlibacter sp.]